mmetsp:Transcript_109725/g.354257  ORF Transcript_109725/g.354257 Transcript_109725/m.354257 type:complete len:234 (-) Transcript_109725:55-756(-)
MALYRHCRSLQQVRAEVDKSVQVLSQLQDGHPPQAVAPQCCQHHTDELTAPGAGRMLPTGVRPGERAGAILQQRSRVSRLQREVKSTTQQANARIGEVGDAIRALREQVSLEQAAHERLRREAAGLRDSASMLQLENERLALQLERREEDVREEVQQLQREVHILSEQKSALVCILEEIYGAGQTERSQKPQECRLSTDSGASSLAADLAETCNTQKQSWTNVLPRPSELLAG